MFIFQMTTKTSYQYLSGVNYYMSGDAEKQNLGKLAKVFPNLPENSLRVEMLHRDTKMSIMQGKKETFVKPAILFTDIEDRIALNSLTGTVREMKGEKVGKETITSITIEFDCSKGDKFNFNPGFNPIGDTFAVSKLKNGTVTVSMEEGSGEVNVKISGTLDGKKVEYSGTAQNLASKAPLDDRRSYYVEISPDSQGKPRFELTNVPVPAEFNFKVNKGSLTTNAKDLEAMADYVKYIKNVEAIGEKNGIPVNYGTEFSKNSELSPLDLSNPTVGKNRDGELGLYVETKNGDGIFLSKYQLSRFTALGKDGTVPVYSADKKSSTKSKVDEILFTKEGVMFVIGGETYTTDQLGK